jgi:hypothetical protein
MQYYYSSLVPMLVVELYSCSHQLKELEQKCENDNDETLMARKLNEERRLEAIKYCASAHMKAVTTAGVNFLCTELGAQIEHESDLWRRQWGCWLLQQFVGQSSANFTDYVAVFLKYLLSRIADTDMELMKAVGFHCWLAAVI